MRFDFNGCSYHTAIWTPKHGKLAGVIALDTETGVIEPGKVPPFVVGQAYNGSDTVYFISLDQLAPFMELHYDSTFTMHNAAFDTSVIENEVGFDFDSMIRGHRLFDTSLMFRLWKLATIGQVPPKYALDFVAKTLLGVEIEKDDEIRLDFGRFRHGKAVDYRAMTERHLRYAAIDSIITFKIFKHLDPKIHALDAKFYLSHKIQLMGAVALDAVSRRGISFDLDGRKILLENLDHEIDQHLQRLAGFGYHPGRRGVKKVSESIIQSLGIQLPRTPKSNNLSMKQEHLEPYRDQHPFIDALLSFQEHEKLKSFIIKLDSPRIHTRFTCLVNTGRTSSSKPNIQNLPRDSRIRGLFIPRPKHIFIISDYSQIELCALSQICIDRYGSSKMATLINSGVDLHCWFASVLTGKPIEDVGADSVERQAAKACNFGFPGGLGVRAFLDYAKKTYGLDGLTESQAQEYREQWLSAFPEMRQYLVDTLVDRHDFSSMGSQSPEIAAAVFRRVVRGETQSKQGYPYNPRVFDWAFNVAMADISPDHVGITVGSPEILEDVMRETIATRTGRMRAKASYCEARNTPFQGLAADGAKIALYRLERAKLQTVGFVHDEFIIEASEKADVVQVQSQIKQIMVEAMRAVVPDIQIRVKQKITKKWQK